MEKISNLFSRVCNSCPEFIDILFKMKAETKVLINFERLCQIEKLKSTKALAVTKLSRVLALVGSADCIVFEQICGPNIMGPILETILNIHINNDLINSLPDMDSLREVLRFLRLLLKNDFDKNVFVVSNAPQAIMKVLVRILDIRAADYRNSSYLCIILREILQLILLMAHDPLIQKNM